MQDVWRRTCITKAMILLITPASRAPEWAQAITAETGQPTHLVAGLQEAAGKLRSEEYAAIILDQFLLDAEPHESDRIMQHLGTSVPLYVNFAICGIQRLVREVKAALARRQREEEVARRSAAQTLRNELKETVTAMLLCSDMALRVAGVPEAAAEKIRTMHELTCDLRLRLGGVE